MNRERILISVIVPVYKVESTIQKCIDSVITAGVSGIEIILVDDGSPDACPMICEDYARQYGFIHCIHKENGGLSSARNAGLRVASGKYVMFLDADDYFDSAGFQALSEKTSWLEADIITFDAVKHSGEREVEMRHVSAPEKTVSGESFVLAEAGKGKIYPAWLSLYKLSFLQKHAFAFWEGILHEDIDFCYQVFLHADTVVYLSIMVYHYVIREQSITTQKNMEKNVEDTIRIFRKYAKLMESYKPSVRHAVMDSMVGSVLSIIAVCGACEVNRHDISGKELFKHAHTIKNKLKSLLFMINKNAYFGIRDYFR